MGELELYEAVIEDTKKSRFEFRNKFKAFFYEKMNKGDGEELS